MKLYRCLWPNGDVSVVLARNKTDAIFELDEVGGATPSYLEEIVDTFMVHFVPVQGRPDGDDDPGGRWALEGFGELTCDESGPLAWELADAGLVAKAKWAALRQTQVNKPRTPDDHH